MATDTAAGFLGMTREAYRDAVDPLLFNLLDRWEPPLSDVRRCLVTLALKALGATTTPAVTDARRWLVRDWLVRTYTPTWLAAAGLDACAATLRGLRSITVQTHARAIKPVWFCNQRVKVAASNSLVDSIRTSSVNPDWGLLRDAVKESGASRTLERGAVRAAEGDWDPDWENVSDGVKWTVLSAMYLVAARAYERDTYVAEARHALTRVETDLVPSSMLLLRRLLRAA